MSARREGVGRKLSADEVRDRFPKAAARIATEAAEAERERIRKIEEVARPGHGELIRRAKYERTDLSAEQVARAMLRRDRRVRPSTATGRTDFNEEDRR